MLNFLDHVQQSILHALKDNLRRHAIVMALIGRNQSVIAR